MVAAEHRFVFENIDRGETRVVLQALRNQLGKPVYPLHRLDKPTSGVLAFALTSEAAQAFGPCFESGQGIRKTYRAVVRGWPLSTASAITRAMAGIDATSSPKAA